MFFDHVKIEVRSGRGGDGAVTFRHEKYVPDGGPDGGDGGRGGDVILTASARKASLIDFRFKHHFSAGDGQKGMQRKKNGKQGEDLILELPPGTLVYDDESGKLIADLREVGQRVVLLRGGLGGRGNVHFKNSIRQAPNFARAGGLPETLQLRLELRLIADVGLLGLPNAGKSSLLAALSNARPKIGSYAFTTLEPQLGIVEMEDASFVLADLPGLIKGAAEGAGLGHEFLRHTARCRLLLHVVDAAPQEGMPEPLEAYRQIRREVENYEESLGQREERIVWNKADLLTEEARDELRKRFAEAGLTGCFVSAATHEGLAELRRDLFALLPALDEVPQGDCPDEDWRLYRFADEEPFRVEWESGEAFVRGSWIENLVRSINFNDTESFHYFQAQIKAKGVNEALAAAGVKEGEWVDIGGSEFQFVPGDEEDRRRR